MGEISDAEMLELMREAFEGVEEESPIDLSTPAGRGEARARLALLDERYEELIDKVAAKIDPGPPPNAELFEYDGIPVSVSGDVATAWDRPGGRPFPGRELSEATRIDRAEFERLLHLPAVTSFRVIASGREYLYVGSELPSVGETIELVGGALVTVDDVTTRADGLPLIHARCRPFPQR
jgi:hypothetical protein